MLPAHLVTHRLETIYSEMSRRTTAAENTSPQATEQDSASTRLPSSMDLYGFGELRIGQIAPDVPLRPEDLLKVYPDLDLYDPTRDGRHDLSVRRVTSDDGRVHRVTIRATERDENGAFIQSGAFTYDNATRKVTGLMVQDNDHGWHHIRDSNGDGTPDWEYVQRRHGANEVRSFERRVDQASGTVVTEPFPTQVISVLEGEAASKLPFNSQCKVPGFGDVAIGQSAIELDLYRGKVISREGQVVKLDRDENGLVEVTITHVLDGRGTEIEKEVSVSAGDQYGSLTIDMRPDGSGTPKQTVIFTAGSTPDGYIALSDERGTSQTNREELSQTLGGKAFGVTMIDTTGDHRPDVVKTYVGPTPW